MPLGQLAIKAGVNTSAARDERAGCARRQVAAEVVQGVPAPSVPIRDQVATAVVAVRAAGPKLCRRRWFQASRRPLAVLFLALPEHGPVSLWVELGTNLIGQASQGVQG